MLRTIFVAIIIAVGSINSLRGPFEALLFYLWLGYFRPEGWLHSNWFTPLRLSLIAGIVTLVQAAIRPAQLRARSNWGVVLLGLAFVQTMVSALDSIAPEFSWAWWTEFAKVLTMGLLITLLVNTQARLRMAILVIVLSLGFEAVKQGWVQLFVNPGGVNTNAHFVLGDNNGVALGMFMLAPLAGALVAGSRGVEKAWHVFFLVGITLRGISTYSRGGFLTAAAVALHALARSRQRVRLLAGVSVLAVVFYSVLPAAFWDRMSTIGAASEERDSSSTGRLYFWELAKRMADDNPWTGVGFNSFSRAYADYDVTSGAYGLNRAVHSTWYGMLAENGYPGLTILLSMLGVSLWNTRQAVRAKPGRDVLAMAKGIQGSLVAFCVGGVFVNAHYNELVWHLFALSVAVRGVAEDEAAAMVAAPDAVSET